MFSKANDGSAFEFSTDQLPERDRAALWRDTIARQAMRIDSQPLPGCTLKVDIRGYAWPGLLIARASLSGMRDERTPELIGDGADEISLVINVSGPVTILARGRETFLDDGDGFAISSLEPTVFTRPSPGVVIGISIPREALDSRLRHLDAGLARLIPRRSETLQLLKSYLAFLLDHRMPIPPDVRLAIVVHVSDLAALVLGPPREITLAMEGLGNAAARLVGIKADVIENIGNLDLTTDWLARRHNLSARYIQLMFERDNTTLSAFILEKRLERAHEFLSDQRNIGRSIGSLASECGFGDPSYFNRVFRKRYRMTPTELRQRATHGKESHQP